MFPIIDSIAPLNADMMALAQAHQQQLTKPPGALGYLETLAIQLAGITGAVAPPLDHRLIIVVAADHGVASEGVSAYPAVVTGQMVANFLEGGAAINVLARAAQAELLVVDAGISVAPIADHPRLRSLRLGSGSANLALGPAMSYATAQRAIEYGIDLAHEVVASGVQVLALGEMGIGNTTAAACITAFCTATAAAAVTGRGTGIDDARLLHKTQVVERAITRLAPAADGVMIVSEVGGFEIGLLAGLILGAAAQRIPVVLDGFITTAAALVAQRLSPQAISYCIAAHCGAEPGHRIALDHLGLRPLLALDLRLGEGSGAALALPLVCAAAKISAEMATFASAGVSRRASNTGNRDAYSSR